MTRQAPKTAAALRAAVNTLVPFKSLPENGLAATQLSNGDGGGGGEDRCMFLVRSGSGEVLFGASHFVRLQDGGAQRGAAHVGEGDFGQWHGVS